MSLIIVESVSKSWSDKDVLRNVCCSLAPRERAGLVGPNGQGKTTLLRIIVGLEESTEGAVQKRQGLRIGYLPQDREKGSEKESGKKGSGGEKGSGTFFKQAMPGHGEDRFREPKKVPDPFRFREPKEVPDPFSPPDPFSDPSSTLRGAMLSAFDEVRRLEAEMHELAAELERAGSRPDEKLLARYGQVQHEFEARGGYTYAHRVEQVLDGLRFPRDHWDRDLAQLSGGQRTRAYLGRLLLESPDVLLLDEPTNHLDLEATEWLEEWLAAFAGAAVIVSHDRYFLDRTTDRTWEISFAHLESYRGNYSHYAVQREERFVERTRRWEAQQVYIEETREFIRRFGAGQRSQEAQGRQKRLDRFLKTEAIPKPQKPPQISMRLSTGQRSGDFALRAVDLKVGYRADQVLVEAEKLEIYRGDRVAVVGANGCGKTTLVRTLLGDLPPLAGQVRPGANVRLGYLSQTHEELPLGMTALECLRQIEPSLGEEKARSLLGGLLLGGDDAFKKVSELSGGQRSRLTLARLTLQKANVLVLDEPTNHLDILSQEVLQEVLGEFPGTILFVSHDRYLIRALANRIWAVAGGTVAALAGDWDKYLAWRQRQAEAAGEAPARAEAAKAKEAAKESHRDRRRRTNEMLSIQRRLAEVEKEIHQLEAGLKSLQDRIGKAGEGGDVEEVTRLGQEYEENDSRLRELFAEWERLSQALEEASPAV